MIKSKWKKIKLSQVKEEDGELVCLEWNEEILFSIERIFYIYDVPTHCVRANHASENAEFVLIALNGQITISLDDGKKEECIVLHESNVGIYVPKQIWMKTYDFSAGAILMVIASKTYEKCTYISSYHDFLTLKAGK